MTDTIYTNEYVSNKNSAEAQGYVDSAKSLASTITPWAAAGEAVSGLLDEGINSIVGDNTNKAVGATAAGFQALADPSDWYQQMYDDVSSGKNIGEHAVGLVSPFLSGMFNYGKEEEELQRLRTENKVLTNDTASGYDVTGGTSAGRGAGGTEIFKQKQVTSANRVEGENLSLGGVVNAAVSIYGATSGMSEGEGDSSSLLSDVVDWGAKEAADNDTINNTIDALHPEGQNSSPYDINKKQNYNMYSPSKTY